MRAFAPSLRPVSFLPLALSCVAIALPTIALPALAQEAQPQPLIEAKQAPKGTASRFEPRELGRIEFKPQALRAPCKITRVLAKDGPVAQNAPLIELACEEADQARLAARTAVEQARIGLQGAENEAKFSARQAELSLAEAKTGLARAQMALTQFIEVDRPDALTEAKAKLDNNQADLDDAKDEFEQLKAMYEGSQVEGQTRKLVLNRAARRLAMADVMLGLAKHKHQQTVEIGIPEREKELRNAVVKAELALERTQAGIAQQQAQSPLALAAARQGLAQAEKAQGKLAADLAGLSLRAPVAGTLIGLEAKAGAECSGVLARVMDLRQGRARWDVPVAQAAAYAVGTTMDVQVPELGLKLQGKVTRLSLAAQAAGPNSALSAELELSSPVDLPPGVALRIQPVQALDKN